MRAWGVLLLMAALAVPATPGVRAADPSPSTVVVMSEDGDPDSLARDNQIFKRAREAIIDRLAGIGLDVVDETLVAPEGLAPGLRRGEAALIAAARALTQPPADVALLLSIHSSAEERDYATVVRARLAGRLLDVHSGRSLGSFEIASPRPRPAPLDCPRPCLLEAAGNEAVDLARQLGAVLGDKLAALEGSAAGTAVTASGQAYRLTFRGFSAEELNDFETYLAVLPGYIGHRLDDKKPALAQYRYESALEPERLDRHLRLSAERVGVGARISVAGRHADVEKTTPSPAR